MNNIDLAKALVNATTLNELDAALENIAIEFKFYNRLQDDIDEEREEVNESLELTSKNGEVFYYEVLIYIIGLISSLMLDYGRVQSIDKLETIITFSKWLKLMIEHCRLVYNIGSNTNLKG